MLRQFAIFTGLQLTGEALMGVLQAPLPGSVVGLICLLILLRFNCGPSEPMEGAARSLTDHLGLLFVHAGVGVVGYAAVVGKDGTAIAIAIAISCVLSLGAVAFLASRVRPSEQRSATRDSRVMR